MEGDIWQLVVGLAIMRVTGVRGAMRAVNCGHRGPFVGPVA
jgi:hypothetical protein